MRYIVILSGTNPATPPPAGLLEGIMQLGEEATKAGAMIDNAGLAPSALGARVTVAGGELSITDGPFTETKELISYAVYETRSKEEAVEWTKRFMKLHLDLWEGWEGQSEIRQIFEP
ncbi:YciI family protein [Flindersiella endophytica]